MSDTPIAPAARGRLRAWWTGRFGARLLYEIAFCGGLLMLYRAIRIFSKDDLGAAFRHSHRVLRLEQMLGMPFESHIQGWLIDHEWAIRGLNWYYVLFHFPGAIALLLWLYLWHGDRYKGFRNLMATVTVAALIIHLVYPLAPPRMMPGFVDTMQWLGPNIYPPNALKGAANQIAAMPSLHFGWALIVAIAVVAVARTPWRWLIVLHPVLMALSIIGTANHWWIDAAAAAMIIVGSIAIWRVGSVALARRRATRDARVQLEAFANANALDADVSRS